MLADAMQIGMRACVFAIAQQPSPSNTPLIKDGYNSGCIFCGNDKSNVFCDGSQPNKPTAEFASCLECRYKLQCGECGDIEHFTWSNTIGWVLVQISRIFSNTM
eukprot:790566_1